MRKGFTLIEMAIVIVIVGLLVGGVMAGRGLIEGAELIKTAKEIKSINLAYRTFLTKYRFPPGDVPDPSRFFPVCDTQLWGSQGNSDEVKGNGDGFINGDNSDGNDKLEMWCSWMNLARAGMYHPIGPIKDYRSPDNPTQDINFENGDAFAQAIWPGNDRNQQIMDMMDESTWLGVGTKKSNIIMLFGNYEVTGEIGFTTNELSQRLDIKLDDGKPTGLFRAFTAVGPCFTNPSGYLPTADSEYDLTESGKNCLLGYDLQ